MYTRARSPPSFQHPGARAGESPDASTSIAIAQYRTAIPGFSVRVGTSPAASVCWSSVACGKWCLLCISPVGWTWYENAQSLHFSPPVLLLVPCWPCNCQTSSSWAQCLVHRSSPAIGLPAEEVLCLRFFSVQGRIFSLALHTPEQMTPLLSSHHWLPVS